ncbi:MAG: hypothetical protein WBQ08_02760 [Candidatus Sulfotelmatobacter sp.]
MNGNAAGFVRLSVGFVGLVALGWVLNGEAAKPARHGIALPTDWTHSHLIFSQPGTDEQAMRLQQDPRFEQQLYRRGQPLRLPAVPAENAGTSSPQLRFPVRLSKSSGLWDESLGANATVGAGNFPAKFSFNSAVANCASATTPDFVVYSTGLTGSNTQASLIAYDNLYTGCTAPVPTVYWAYDTGGQILTSPVLSRDGTQLAFTQSAGGIGSLVLLKWASAAVTVSTPVVLANTPAASYATCVAPCMTSLILQDTSHVPTNDITSSVFYNYSGDTIWVGDSRSWLHRFNPVFAAGSTPAEVGAPWPVQLFPTDATALASPVYDHGSGNVFVGDAGGFFYSVSAATGAVTTSSQIDHGTGIVAGPIVDSTAEVAYVFSSNDGSAACAGGPCAAVYRFASGFTGGTAGTKVTVGASSATAKPLYEGALDSAYENSTNATGNLYVCGNTGGDPTLYQVPIAAGVPGTVVTGPVLTTAATACSPVTHILNPNAIGGSTEYIFASVQTKGTSTPCTTAPATGGCIMNFKDTPWMPSTAYTLGQEVVDSHFQVQMVFTAGTSGTSAPTWSTLLVAPASETADGTGTLKWLNLGVTTAATPAAWQPSHTYAVGKYIEDTNSNIQVVTAIVGNGHSRAANHPAWKTVVGQTTTDHNVTWTEAGPAPGALAATGGTSGVIIDNTVETGVSGSQIYFSTQGNQPTCGAATNVGCAVQASQSALK